MDDNTPRSDAYTEVTVRIPDDLARRLGTGGAVERRVLEALALDEFRQGHLDRAELLRLLGFETKEGLDDFLQAHDTPGPGAPDEKHGSDQLGELDNASSLSDWSLADPAMERCVAFGQAALDGMKRLAAWQRRQRLRYDPAQG
jgi:hypothetical protein